MGKATALRARHPSPLGCPLGRREGPGVRFRRFVDHRPGGAYTDRDETRGRMGGRVAALGEHAPSMIKRFHPRGARPTFWRIIVLALLLLTGCSAGGDNPAAPPVAGATPTAVAGLPAPTLATGATSAASNATATIAAPPTAIPTGTPRPPAPTPTPQPGQKPTPKGAQTL